jgi:putative glycosyltransferase (TIGR04372 family)
MIPTANLAPGPNDLSIPKILWSVRDSRPLKFSEVFSRGLANALHASEYAEAAVLPQENTPDEILDLVMDMLDRLDAEDECAPWAPDELSKTFYRLFGPGDYAYGAASGVSPRFLTRNRALLDSSDDNSRNREL